MSQLRTVGKASIGQLALQAKLGWADVVQLVLKVTIEAYQAMYEANVAQSTWEENTFTYCLGETYLQPIALQSGLFIVIQEEVPTEGMKLGKEKTITAKVIDLALFGTWENYRKKRFIWEAKRVGDKRLNKSRESLNSEYINEAIYRYIRREYADGVDDAGVLAYVLEGNVQNIVTDINKTMGKLRHNSPLSPSNHVLPAQPIGNFRNIFSSQHIRNDSTNIRLHHLFLTFDFSAEKALGLRPQPA